MIQCAASLQSGVPGCWTWHRKRAVSKLFSRPSYVPVAHCVCAKSRLLSENACGGNRKCHSASHYDFFSIGCTRCSSTFSAALVTDTNTKSWVARRRPYNTRPQESSADASRQTWLELSPNTT